MSPTKTREASVALKRTLATEAVPYACGHEQGVNKIKIEKGECFCF